MKRRWYSMMILTALLMSSAVLAAPDKPPAKYRACYKVYKDVLDAIGRLDPVAPKLTPSSDENIIAEINPQGEIVVGEKLIDFCRGLGADSLNALALIIAHELGHHYNQHFWVKEYGSAYANVAWGRRVQASFKDINEMGVYESQADEFALFYSYVAGYDALHMAGTIYRKLYAHFGLKEELKGYPSLNERIMLARLSAQRVKKLIPVFEAGKMLIVLANSQGGDKQVHLLDMAIACFEHIVNQKFVSREMYNNLGVCYTMKAIEEIDTIKCKYPVVLDDDSRLFDIRTDWSEGLSWEGTGQGGGGSGGGGGGWGNEEWDRSGQYLDQAENYFMEARKLDRTYIPAYINLGVVHALSGNWYDAEFGATKAKKWAEKKDKELLEAYATEVLAIVRYYTGEPEEALTLFNEAKELGCKLSVHNITKLLGVDKLISSGGQTRTDTNSALADTTFAWGSFFTKTYEKEKVQGLPLPEFMRSVPFTEDDVYKLAGGGRIIMKEVEDAEVYVIQCRSFVCLYDAILLYQVKSPSRQATMQQVQIADSLDKVEAVYGLTDDILAAANIQYYVYPESQIAFHLDKDDQVNGWTVFELMMSDDYLRNVETGLDTDE